VNAALHAGLGSSPPLLLPLRDVVQAARHPAVDWGRLEDWASRWRVGVALAHAFEAAETELAVELPPEARAIAAIPPARVERSALRAYGERRRAGGMALAAVRAIPGVRPKTTYVLGLLLPSREFLQARARGRAKASYVARWGVPVRWLARRRRSASEITMTKVGTRDDR
jgi:hypothetical protein